TLSAPTRPRRVPARVRSPSTHLLRGAAGRYTPPPLRRSARARRAKTRRASLSELWGVSGPILLGLGGRLGGIRRQAQRRVVFSDVRQTRPIGGGGWTCFRFRCQHVSLRRVLPGHDEEPVGGLLIGGDQREAKADVGLSAEIRGTWHGGTPPGFFLQRPSRGTVPDERRWPFLRGLPVSVVLRGPTSSERAAMGN